MAIDTENKRRSVQAYTFGLVRPIPDGTIAAPDRATSAWYYSGITYASEGAAIVGRFMKPFGFGFGMFRW